MLTFSVPFYLASKSPRRKELLQFIINSFQIISADIDESPKENELPIEYSERISREKLIAIKKKANDGVILSADTIVTIDEHILGKPKNREDAFRMLKLLSGNYHEVITSYSLGFDDKIFTKSVSTKVKFIELTDDLIESYIDTNSPMDKAGAYGIQDSFGAVMIEKIEGCYYNVMGLPVSSLYYSLKELKKQFSI